MLKKLAQKSLISHRLAKIKVKIIEVFKIGKFFISSWR